MKNFFCRILFIFLVFSNFSFAQLSIKDQDSTPNTLLKINDEGISGSITLPPLSSIGTPTNKLYNKDNFLFWNGIALGTSGSAAGWTDLGSNVILSSPSDKVGIGTSTPSAVLHVTGNDGALFEGTIGSGSIPKEGAGTRVMWYPYKGAFRAGVAIGTEWDNVNIGDFSIALGIQNTASGSGSIAMGAGNTASENSSTAMGNSTTASGEGSTAMGLDTQASGPISTAMGLTTIASGASSTAMGFETQASGDNSTAMGMYSKAASFSSTAIGYNNIGGGSDDVWIENDPLFEIGNGITMIPANALTVLKNGNVGIGIHNPSYKLDISGGNLLVRGDDGFTASGHEGIVHLGSVHHFIKGEYGFGLKLGTYAAGDVISVRELSGNVGIGNTSPNEKLEVEGKIRANSGFNVNGTNGISGTFDFFNDGTSGNVVRMTFTGGILTSVEKAP